MLDFKFGSYPEMKSAFRTKIVEVLLRKHKVRTVDELEDERRSQVQFLEKVIAQLDELKTVKMEKSEDSQLNKARILTGCMYVIHDEIRESYEKALIPRDPNTWSQLYPILQEVMGIQLTNKLDSLSKRIMLSDAEKFMVGQVCQEGSLVKELFPDHPFSQVRDFDTLKFLLRLGRIREEATSACWEEKFAKMAFEQQAQKDAREPAKSSILSRFSFGFGNSPSVQPSVQATAPTSNSAATSSYEQEFPAIQSTSVHQIKF